MAIPTKQSDIDRILTLEHRDDVKDSLIAELERMNQALVRRVEVLEKEKEENRKFEAMQKKCVFSVRLNLTHHLDANGGRWKRADNVVSIYTQSEYFVNNDGTFEAPISGEYSINMGFRTNGHYGGLEAMLVFPNHLGINAPDVRLIRVYSGPHDSVGVLLLHAFVGKTWGFEQSCDRTVLLSLRAGDKVGAVFRRTSGWTDVQWCVLTGLLVKGDLPCSH